MNIWNNKWFRLSIHKSGKFYRKVQLCPHRKSMAEMKWTNEGECSDLYTGHHYLVTHLLQIFWLWFIIALEIKEEKLSSSKYVNYESTHYAMLDEQLTKKP